MVTFSFAQRNLITELLELRRRQDTTLDQFLREGQSEDLFVKNIENVQGDERDVILVSVGYGPAIAGGRLTSMSFGPVNGEGGERRLNVLFTRARIRCEVFASFDPGDIDLNRTSREGPRILKRFLDFAKNGRLDVDSPTGLDADSPFEEDVADVVRGTASSRTRRSDLQVSESIWVFVILIGRVATSSPSSVMVRRITALFGPGNGTVYVRMCLSTSVGGFIEFGVPTGSIIATLR